ncbi:MAG: 30S ribosomal protein S17 [Candidatus Omnitrophota bacterium]|jgi:small subunit ribosomal protein S17
MGKRKELTGLVVSDKMQKTVVVKVLSISKHPKYSRIMKSHNKFKAHDEKGIAKLGDTVRIEETRPLSKDKRFRVLKVVKKAEAANIAIDDVKETE